MNNLIISTPIILTSCVIKKRLIKLKSGKSTYQKQIIIFNILIFQDQIPCLIQLIREKRYIQSGMISNTINKFFKSKSKDFFWTQISRGVKSAQYAVRGIVPTTAGIMKQQIDKKTKTYPFNQITFCNIGNPQEFHQKPITFNRQVVACLLDPGIMQLQGINKDAAKRAQRYLDQIISAGSYTHSLGIPLVRQTVANYIAREDGIQPPSIEDIFLTEGASQGVHLILNSIITSPNDSIMIPIPQYPLYSAAISLYQGHPAPYYLNQEKGWQLDLQELEDSLNNARSQGKTVKCIVVINPGNPTGACLSEQTIEKIIQFSVKNKIVIIADEVYRQNIYKEGTKFISFRKVLSKMSENVQNNCQLASLHSTSKGLLGQCGLRGGYLYIHNFNPQVVQQLIKLKSINLCSNSVGQVMVDLMCNPPLSGVSEQTKSLYEKEVKDLYDSLKHRASLVTKALREMKNITTNEVEGAMYAFPQIKFSKKAIEAAGNQAPDLFYCLQVLKNTGIALVPGSGFRQRPGTHHFRITTLILPEQKLHHKLQALKKFNEQFHKKYE